MFTLLHFCVHLSFFMWTFLHSDNGVCCSYQPSYEEMLLTKCSSYSRKPAYRCSVTVGRMIDAQNTARPFVIKIDSVRLTSNKMKLKRAISHSLLLQMHTLLFYFIYLFICTVVKMTSHNKTYIQDNEATSAALTGAL